VSSVKHSPALKWSIVILLTLTIAWKLAVKPENPIEIQDAIVEFLADQQFDVTVTGETIENKPIIEENSDSCRFRVAKISPLGHEADPVRHIGMTTDRSYYVFRGMVYSEQPVWLTVASYLWFRFLRELSLVSRIPPVIAVVSRAMLNNYPGAHFVRNLIEP
jgi:hypothetical protein